MRTGLDMRSASAMVVALALVLSHPVHAASNSEVKNCISSIRRLYGSLDYEHALSQIQLARQMPRGTEDEVILSLYEGMILYEMGRKPDALVAFRSALLLRPDALLPEKVAPKVEKNFEAIRLKVRKEIAPTVGPTASSRVTEQSKKEQESLPVVVSPGRSPSATAANDPLPSATATVQAKCQPIPPKPSDPGLTPQQLWRLAGLQYELCAKGQFRGQRVGVLASLASQLRDATSNYQRIRVRQQIDQFALEVAGLSDQPAPSDEAVAAAKPPRAPAPQPSAPSQTSSTLVAASASLPSSKPTASAPPIAPAKCEPAAPKPTDPALGPQQLWRLAAMAYELCTKGRLHGQTAETLSGLTTQMKQATSNYQRLRLRQQIDLFASRQGL